MLLDFLNVVFSKHSGLRRLSVEVLVDSLIALEEVDELVFFLVLGQPCHDDLIESGKLELLAAHVLIQEGFSLLYRQVRV